MVELIERVVDLAQLLLHLILTLFSEISLVGLSVKQMAVCSKRRCVLPVARKHHVHSIESVGLFCSVA